MQKLEAPPHSSLLEAEPQKQHLQAERGNETLISSSSDAKALAGDREKPDLYAHSR